MKCINTCRFSFQLKNKLNLYITFLVAKGGRGGGSGWQVLGNTFILQLFKCNNDNSIRRLNQISQPLTRIFTAKELSKDHDKAFRMTTFSITSLSISTLTMQNRTLSINDTWQYTYSYFVECFQSACHIFYCYVECRNADSCYVE